MICYFLSLLFFIYFYSHSIIKTRSIILYLVLFVILSIFGQVSVLKPGLDEDVGPFAWIDQAVNDKRGAAGAITHRRGARVEVSCFGITYCSSPCLVFLFFVLIFLGQYDHIAGDNGAPTRRRLPGVACRVFVLPRVPIRAPMRCMYYILYLSAVRGATY